MEHIEANEFDVLLQGGRVICPASGLDGVMDLAIRDRKIAAIGPGLTPTRKTTVVNVKDRLVLPGLIDTHAHVFRYVTGRFGLPADLVGVQSGVTTLVDQGGPSCITLPSFRHFISEQSKTRTYVFISTYLAGGLEGHFYSHLASPNAVNVEAVVKAAIANRDLVRGVKAHAEIGGFARWGIRVIEMAAQIGREASLPVYVHFGQMWGLPESGANGEDVDTILKRVIPVLREGDILAHPFTRHPGGFISLKGQIHPVIHAALEKGLKIDVGYGSHFSYANARKMIEAGIIPTTLGADIHGFNTDVPPPPGSTPPQDSDVVSDNVPWKAQRFSLVQAMSSMMALGLTLEQVIPMVTSNAASMLAAEDEIGALRVGRQADVSILRQNHGRFRLSDNEGTEVTLNSLLQPEFCYRNGERFDANATILPTATAA